MRMCVSTEGEIANTMLMYFSAKRRAASVSKGFSLHSLVLLVMWKHDRVCRHC